MQQQGSPANSCSRHLTCKALLDLTFGVPVTPFALQVLLNCCCCMLKLQLYGPAQSVLMHW